MAKVRGGSGACPPSSVFVRVLHFLPPVLGETALQRTIAPRALQLPHQRRKASLFHELLTRIQLSTFGSL